METPTQTAEGTLLGAFGKLAKNTLGKMTKSTRPTVAAMSNQSDQAIQVGMPRSRNPRPTRVRAAIARITLARRRA